MDGGPEHRPLFDEQAANIMDKNPMASTANTI